MCFIIATVIWLWVIRLRYFSEKNKGKMLLLGSWKFSSVGHLSSLLKGKHYNTHRLLTDLTHVTVNSWWDYRKSNRSSCCRNMKPPARMWKHFIWMWNLLVTLLWRGQHRGNHIQGGCLFLGLTTAVSSLWQVMAPLCVPLALSMWGWF